MRKVIEIVFIEMVVKTQGRSRPISNNVEKQL